MLLATAPTGIILETNFRLYAYVSPDSPILGILCYFAKLEVCLKKFYVFLHHAAFLLPGLVIGLTTDLILHFLEATAHPAMPEEHCDCGGRGSKPEPRTPNYSRAVFSILNRHRRWWGWPK